MRTGRLRVVHRWSRSTLGASGVAFYVYPIPLQRIVPFSRVKSPYIIQHTIPPPAPPHPNVKDEALRCELISTLPDTLRLRLLSTAPSRFHRAASQTLKIFHLGVAGAADETADSKKSNNNKKTVKESVRRSKGDKQNVFCMKHFNIP